MPIVVEFALAQQRPLQDQAFDPRRQAPLQDRQRVDGNDRLCSACLVWKWGTRCSLWNISMTIP